MAGFENNVMLAKNGNFDPTAAKPHLGILDAEGKVFIGTGDSFPTPEILAGNFTSPNGSITFGYDSPNITAVYNNASVVRPAFSAALISDVANATGAGTLAQVMPYAWDEAFDTQANFDASTGAFTAPFEGIYFFTYQISMGNLTAAMTTGDTQLGGSVAVFLRGLSNYGAQRSVATTADIYQDGGSVVVYLTPGERAWLQVVVLGGAGDTATILGQNGTTFGHTYFMGYLVQRLS